MQILFLIDIEAGPGPGPQFLQLRHVDGLGAFLALDHIKFDFLSLFERFEALAVDTGIVHEYIISVRIADKTEPTLIVKTSDYTFTHAVTSKL